MSVHAFITCSVTPFSSLPITTAQGSAKFILSIVFTASRLDANICMPFAFNISMAFILLDKNFQSIFMGVSEFAIFKKIKEF